MCLKTLSDFGDDHVAAVHDYLKVTLLEKGVTKESALGEWKIK